MALDYLTMESNEVRAALALLETITRAIRKAAGSCTASMRKNAPKAQTRFANTYMSRVIRDKFRTLLFAGGEVFRPGMGIQGDPLRRIKRREKRCQAEIRETQRNGGPFSNRPQRCRLERMRRAQTLTVLLAIRTTEQSPAPLRPTRKPNDKICFLKHFNYLFKLFDAVRYSF